jgi:putative SOS response-associated peptidase YedK
MCGRYVVTNPISKTKGLVKTAIKVEDKENYNAHPYQDLPVIKKYSNSILGKEKGI